MTVREIKTEAKERFIVNRYQAMLAYCIVFFIVLNVLVVTAAVCMLSQILPLYVSLILWIYGMVLILIIFVMMAPFGYSMSNFYLKSYKGQKLNISTAFDGFNKYNLERVIIAFILKSVFTLLLTALLIVPGVIFAIRTSMSMYLLRANPKMKPMESLKASSKVMSGHCGLYFKLRLSFIGWYLLGILTFGAAFIYVLPYTNTCKVVFYKRVLQGDKTMYKIPEMTNEITGDNEGVKAADEAGDDDDKNVAIKLMKAQLSDEIKNIDKKMSSVKPISDEKEEKEIYSENDEDYDSILSGQIEDINRMIEGETQEKSALGAKSIIGDSYDEDATKPSFKTTTKEDIQQRIEKLKKEREQRTMGRPAKPVKPPLSESEQKLSDKAKVDAYGASLAPNAQTFSDDEFGPEKIDVEILED